MDWDQRQHEDETEGYKRFLKVAKEIKKIDYDSHWRIVPDMSDPLRKYILERDIAWTTIKVSISMRQSYKRGVWDDNRYFYKPMIVVSGLFAHQLQPQYIKLDMEVKPRMAKKIVEAINTVIIPKFYQAIEQEKSNWEASCIKNQHFKDNIAKVKGLKVIKGNWGHFVAELQGCPLGLRIVESSDSIEVNGTMSFDDLAKMAELNGWGK